MREPHLPDKSFLQALENTPDRHEFRHFLGGGHYGIVYCVYSHTWRRYFALKVRQERYDTNALVKEWFRKEANIWMEIGKHPYFVHVYWVDEIAGRLCIVMDYIPKNERGFLTLQDYLEKEPLDIAQNLRWAIQFCHAMTYAYSKGVTCHRDIKPGNILIGPKSEIQITDFGLGDSVGARKAEIEQKLTIEDAARQEVDRKINNKVDAYLPHMPPEWWPDESACNERLDIYSFGFTLFRMINKGRKPFVGNTSEDYEAFHKFGKIDFSETPQEASPLFPIIDLCVKKNPNDRYQTFDELRSDLEHQLRSITGEEIAPPSLRKMAYWEWNNKGRSRIHLKHCDDALLDFEKALQECPRLAQAWRGKGECYQVLASVAAHKNDGRTANLCRDKASVAFYNATLLDPDNFPSWFNWGNLYRFFGDDISALECYHRAAQIDPNYVRLWINKADSEFDLDHKQEAKKSYRRFIKLADPTEWKSQLEHAYGRLKELETSS
jgi:serine/threonine protein kinase